MSMMPMGMPGLPMAMGCHGSNSGTVANLPNHIQCGVSAVHWYQLIIWYDHTFLKIYFCVCFHNVIDTLLWRLLKRCGDTEVWRIFSNWFQVVNDLNAWEQDAGLWFLWRLLSTGRSWWGQVWQVEHEKRETKMKKLCVSDSKLIFFEAGGSLTLVTVDICDILSFWRFFWYFIAIFVGEVEQQ